MGFSSAVAEREEAAIERRVHDAEVAEFGRDVMPHLRALEVVSTEIGPLARSHALAAQYLVHRLVRRWTDPEAA